MLDASRRSVFFGGWVTVDEVAAITFGDEGQGWDLMPVADFLGHKGAVPEMQRTGRDRLGRAWAGNSR